MYFQRIRQSIHHLRVSPIVFRTNSQSHQYPFTLQRKMSTAREYIPIINVQDLVGDKPGKGKVAQEIGNACRNHGFFYVKGHGVSEPLQTKIEKLSRELFKLPLETKMKCAVKSDDPAWRGYFQVGNEKTLGKVDYREGYYFGDEMNSFVQNGTLLHGPNIYPDDELPHFRPVVEEYLEAMKLLGRKLMEGIALSLGLDENYFYDHYTKEALILLNITNYPAQPAQDVVRTGIGEHTDYGILSIVKQDLSVGGLEIKVDDTTWIPATPIPGTFVCNIGDMLELITGGFYRSTIHRVKCPTTSDRISFPFFFDPNFNSQVRLMEGLERFGPEFNPNTVHQLSGTYGEYLRNKTLYHK